MKEKKMEKVLPIQKLYIEKEKKNIIQQLKMGVVMILKFTL